MEIRDDIWLPTRLWMELVQFSAGYICEDCGRDRGQLKESGHSGRLTAHHLDENKENNFLKNGRCLCPSCHGKHHGGSEKCPPGCQCRKHRSPAHKRDTSLPCRNGHIDWVVWGGNMRCRTCTNQKLRDYYYSNQEYRERQISGSTIRRRAKREGERS